MNYCANPSLALIVKLRQRVREGKVSFRTVRDSQVKIMTESSFEFWDHNTQCGAAPSCAVDTFPNKT